MEGYIINKKIKKAKKKDRGNGYPETRLLKDGRHYINKEAFKAFKLKGSKVTISEADFPEAEL